MREYIGFVLALAVSIVSAAEARAQVLLLDQWVAAATTPLGGPESDANAGNFAAEDFVTTSSVLVSQLEFRGSYLFSTAPTNPVPFLVNFRQDTGGLPGAIVAGVVPTISQTLLASAGGFSLYSFTATLVSPVALSAGAHWVEIRETQSDPSLFFRWEFADATDPARGRAGLAVAPPSTGIWALAPGALSLRVRGLVTPVELLQFDVE